MNFGSAVPESEIPAQARESWDKDPAAAVYFALREGLGLEPQKLPLNQFTGWRVGPLLHRCGSRRARGTDHGASFESEPIGESGAGDEQRTLRCLSLRHRHAPPQLAGLKKPGVFDLRCRVIGRLLIAMKSPQRRGVIT